MEAKISELFDQLDVLQLEKKRVADDLNENDCNIKSCEKNIAVLIRTKLLEAGVGSNDTEVSVNLNYRNPVIYN